MNYLESIKKYIFYVLGFFTLFACQEEAKDQLRPELYQYTPTSEINEVLTAFPANIASDSLLSQAQKKLAEGAVDEALNYGLAAYAVREKSSVDSSFLLLLKYLPIFYINNGDIASATDVSRYACDLCEDKENEPNSKICADILFNISVFYTMQKRWGKQRIYLNKARALFEQEYPKGSSKKCNIYTLESEVFMDRRMYQEAEKALLAAIDCQLEIGGTEVDLIPNVSNLMMVYLNTNRTQKALDLVLAQLRELKKSDDKCSPRLLAPYNDLGIVYAQMGEYQKSIEHYLATELIENCPETFFKNDSITLYGNVALSYLKMRDNKQAEKFYKKSLSYVSNSGESITFSSHLSSLLGLAQVAYVRANEEDDEQLYQVVDDRYLGLLDAIIKYRNNFSEGAGRVVYLNKYKYYIVEAARFYQDYYETTGEKELLAKFWYALNLAKSTHLEETLSVEFYDRSISTEIEKLNEQLNQAENEPVSEQLNNEIFNLTEKLYQKAGLQKKLPDSYEAEFNTRFRDEIPLDIAVVEYLTNDSVLLAMVQIGTETTTYRLDDPSFVMEQVRNYNEIVRVPSAQKVDLTSASKNLYHVLLQPLGIDFSKLKRVIFIPDGELRNLSFSTLTDLEGKRLTELTAISYAYSGTLFASRDQKMNPLNSPRFIGFAPGFSNDVNDEKVIDQFNTRSVISDFGELEHNIDEVKSIALRLSGKVFQNETATYDNLLKAIEQADILHIASHAGTDESGYPFLIVSNEGESDYRLVGNQNFLYKKTAAALVVISACKTASGNNSASEGVESLQRAFYQIGAKAVVSTLWEVDDYSSKILMDQFYAALKMGKTKSVALNYAIKKLRENPNYDHPVYWGGYRVFGNDQALY